MVFVQVFTSTRGQFTLLFLYKTCVHVEPKDSEGLPGVWFVVLQIVCFEVVCDHQFLLGLRRPEVRHAQDFPYCFHSTAGML